MKLKWLALVLCGVGLLDANIACLEGQDAGTSTVQAAAPIQFTVIESKRVREGNHSVIYNRVLPPQLPAADSSTATNTAPVTQAGHAVLQARPAPMKSVALLISATVFNHQITEIGWTVNGVAYRGYSNIDFSVLDGLTQFTSADTVYTLLLLTSVPGPNPHTGVAPAVPSIPQLPALTPTQSDYVIVAQNGQDPPDEAFTPMDDLHAYFDAHRADIATLHTQYQANIAAQAQWQKDHPPVPQDTVINFWPIKSRIYGDAKQ
jgi:hypothetical protein